MKNGINNRLRSELSIDPDVEVISLSADNSIIDAAMEAGPVGFMKKPVSVSAIVAAVRAVA